MGLNSLLESGNIRMHVSVWQSKGEEQLARIDALEFHERELLNDVLRLESQLAMVRVEKECHDPQDVGSPKVFTDAKVAVRNA